MYRATVTAADLAAIHRIRAAWDAYEAGVAALADALLAEWNALLAEMTLPDPATVDRELARLDDVLRSKAAVASLGALEFGGKGSRWPA